MCQSMGYAHQCSGLIRRSGVRARLLHLLAGTGLGLWWLTPDARSLQRCRGLQNDARHRAANWQMQPKSIRCLWDSGTDGENRARYGHLPRHNDELEPRRREHFRIIMSEEDAESNARMGRSAHGASAARNGQFRELATCGCSWMCTSQGKDCVLQSRLLHAPRERRHVRDGEAMSPCRRVARVRQGNAHTCRGTIRCATRKSPLHHSSFSDVYRAIWKQIRAHSRTKRQVCVPRKGKKTIIASIDMCNARARACGLARSLALHPHPPSV